MSELLRTAINKLELGNGRQGNGDNDRGEEQCDKELELGPLSDNQENGETLKLMKEEEHLLGIFPEEVWELILDKVPDCDDNLENIINASLYFRKLLNSQKVIFLFPKVWSILGDKFNTNRIAYSHGDESYQEPEVEPAENESSDDSDSDSEDGVKDTWWYTGLLRFRLVCRRWCQGITNFYDHHPAHFHWDEEKATDQVTLFILGFLTHKFAEMEYLNGDATLVTRQGRTHGAGAVQRNPFFGRRIEIKFDDFLTQNPTDAFPQALVRMLRNYGHFFWYCQFTSDDFGRSAVQTYSCLRRILEHLPNLKTLQIKSSIDNHLSRVEVARMEAEIRVHPLPTLPSLQYLGSIYLPGPIFNEIVRRNQHVSTLQVLRDGTPRDYDLNLVSPSTLQNLRIGFDMEDEYRRFANVPHTWPLGQLALYFQIRDAFIDWPGIFAVLEEKWAGTLTDLTIQLPEACRKQDKNEIISKCNDWRLNLGKITRLKVLMPNLSSLDFILPMKNLEVLKVHVKLADDWNCKSARVAGKGQAVRFIGYFDRLLKSNIWTLFPKLQSVHVEDFDGMFGMGQKWTYARKQWELQRGKVQQKK